MHLQEVLQVIVGLVQVKRKVKNPLLPHGASSKEKAILAIHPSSFGRNILAFHGENEEVTQEKHILN